MEDRDSTCPDLVNGIKAEIQQRLDSSGAAYSKFLNFPSCSQPDWAELYWGSHLQQLEDIKARVDPTNVFNHCQSVGSTDNGEDCCPFSGGTSPAASVCKTTEGKVCRFPFTHNGQTHTACTHQVDRHL